jgi:hypothetical protein
MVGFTKHRAVQDINSVEMGTTTNPNFVFMFLGEGGVAGAVDL